MTTTTTDTLSHLRQSLRAIDPAGDDYAKRFVDVLLNAAIIVEAGDVHAQPTAGGLWVRWRIDGVLQEVGEFPAGESSDVVARIKVLASLLTETSGAILVTGPAGSGKTTTCYAALRHLLQSTGPLVRRMEFHNTPSTAVG